MKIAVIGEATAGLLAAYELARRGAEVEIFRGENGVAPASRTLIVTDKVRKFLGHENGLEWEGLILNQIRRFELLADGRVGEIRLKRPDYVVDRARVLAELKDRVKKAGVRVREGVKFKNFLRVNKYGLVEAEDMDYGRELNSKEHLGAREIFKAGERNGGEKTIGGKREAGKIGRGTEQNKSENKLSFVLEDIVNKQEIVESADIVIGADGATSQVARAAGWPEPRLLYLIQAVCPLPENCAPETTRIWFIPKLTPYFFWLIPESAERCVVGLIGEDKEEAERALLLFLERKKILPLDFQAGWVPYSRCWLPVRKKLPGGEVYLVGDAAGHVKLTTVGGFVTGAEGALGVVEAILNSGRSRRLVKLGLELAAHRLVRAVLHRFGEKDYSRLISFLNGAAKEVLGRISRDEPLALLWHFAWRAPQVGLLSVIAFLRRTMLGGAS